MGFFIVILFLALSGWELVALLQRLRRQRATPGLWIAFGVLVACGLVVGVWCTFHVEYQLGSRFRVGGFPIPDIIYHLEGGQWMDFPVPEFQAWAAAFTNVITMTALATIPLWLASRIHSQNKS